MMRWRCHTYRGVCVCVCVCVSVFPFCMWMGSNPEPGVSESSQYPLDGASYLLALRLGPGEPGLPALPALAAHSVWCKMPSFPGFRV